MIFYCNFTKNKNDSKAVLLFTDTHRLMYEIEAGNVYEESYKVKELFDNSNYSKESSQYDEMNNLSIGKMNDETVGILLKNFVEL